MVHAGGVGKSNEGGVSVSEMMNRAIARVER